MSRETVWFSAGPAGLQVHQPMSRRGDGRVHLADSLRMAVAQTRGLDHFPCFYGVNPIDQPEATDNPGVFLCHDATVVYEVESPNWTNEELWPLVSATKWPDGSPMYTKDAFITDPPGFPATENARKAIAVVKATRCLLPAQVMRQVRDAAGTPWVGGLTR